VDYEEILEVSLGDNFNKNILVIELVMIKFKDGRIWITPRVGNVPRLVRIVISMSQNRLM